MDCTIQRGLKPVVHTAPDNPISGLLCTKLVYAQYSCAPKRDEHGDRYRTDYRARRGHPARTGMGRARRRAEIIGPLAQSETVGHEAADAAAQALGLSRRQVYVLIRRARLGSGLVTDLALGQSSGGKGKGRLPESVERIIRELLQKRFLTKQKRSLAAFHREVVRACKLQKLRVPARNTVALRIAGLPIRARPLTAGKDKMPPATCKVLVVFRHPSPRRWSRCRSTTQSST